MQIPKECLVYTPLKDGRGHLTGTVSIGLKNGKGDVVLKEAGQGKAGAEVALLTKLQHMATNVNLFGAPQILFFRGSMIFLFVTHNGYWTWSKLHQLSEDSYLGGSTIYESYEEAIRAARVALAWQHWDYQEETSPIIYYPPDQKQFTEQAKRAKKQDQLRSLGWGFDEANYIIDRLTHLIPAERFAAMPPIPENIHQ